MLEGKRIRLWALERYDLLKNFTWGNDRELINLTGMQPYPKSSWEVERWYETVVNSLASRIFAIKTKEGEYIGNIELSSIDPRSARAEMGLILGERQFWNQGYGEEAIRLVLEFAFGEMRLHRVYARILDYNAMAQRCFEKCGFAREGVERESHFSKGRYWDVIQMSILDHEFVASSRDEKKET